MPMGGVGIRFRFFFYILADRVGGNRLCHTRVADTSVSHIWSIPVNHREKLVQQCSVFRMEGLLASLAASLAWLNGLLFSRPASPGRINGKG